MSVRRPASASAPTAQPGEDRLKAVLRAGLKEKAKSNNRVVNGVDTGVNGEITPINPIQPVQLLGSLQNWWKDGPDARGFPSTSQLRESDPRRPDARIKNMVDVLGRPDVVEANGHKWEYVTSSGQRRLDKVALGPTNALGGTVEFGGLPGQERALRWQEGTGNALQGLRMPLSVEEYFKSENVLLGAVKSIGGAMTRLPGDKDGVPNEFIEFKGERGSEVPEDFLLSGASLKKLNGMVEPGSVGYKPQNLPSSILKPLEQIAATIQSAELVAKMNYASANPELFLDDDADTRPWQNLSDPWHGMAVYRKDGRYYVARKCIWPLMSDPATRSPSQPEELLLLFNMVPKDGEPLMTGFQEAFGRMTPVLQEMYNLDALLSNSVNTMLWRALHRTFSGLDGDIPPTMYMALRDESVGEVLFGVGHKDADQVKEVWFAHQQTKRNKIIAERRKKEEAVRQARLESQRAAEAERAASKAEWEKYNKKLDRERQAKEDAARKADAPKQKLRQTIADLERDMENLETQLIRVTSSKPVPPERLAMLLEKARSSKAAYIQARDDGPDDAEKLSKRELSEATSRLKKLVANAPDGSDAQEALIRQSQDATLRLKWKMKVDAAKRKYDDWSRRLEAVSGKTTKRELKDSEYKLLQLLHEKKMALDRAETQYAKMVEKDSFSYAATEGLASVVTGVQGFVGRFVADWY